MAIVDRSRQGLSHAQQAARGVTTAADEKGRPTVYAFLNAAMPWVAPGRPLDKASEGLFLLTNDSEWAARVMSPSRIWTDLPCANRRVADTALLESIGKGIITDDGDFLRVAAGSCSCAEAAQLPGSTLFWTKAGTVTFRRLLTALGVTVLRLVRVAIGPLPLGQLPKGSVRPLTEKKKSARPRPRNKSVPARPIPPPVESRRKSPLSR